MSYYMALHPGPSAIRSEKYSSETLRRIGRQAESLLSQRSRLEMHRRLVEWQLGLIAEQMQVDDVLLVPGSVFPLLETRGSVDVSAHLEQIARILGEAGYGKPAAREQEYLRQDVQQLGKSAQKLFDDCAALDRRARQLQARLDDIKAYLHMGPETPPQQLFEGLAVAPDRAKVRELVESLYHIISVMHAEHPNTSCTSSGKGATYEGHSHT